MLLISVPVPQNCAMKVYRESGDKAVHILNLCDGFESSSSCCSSLC
jgi:hypothetical protein